MVTRCFPLRTKEVREVLKYCDMNVKLWYDILVMNGNISMDCARITKVNKMTEMPYSSPATNINLVKPVMF